MAGLTRRQTLASGMAGAAALAAAGCSGRTGAPDGFLRVAIETEPDSLIRCAASSLPPPCFTSSCMPR